MKLDKPIDISFLVNSALLYKLVIVVIFLNILDSASTLVGLRLGLAEANPFASFSLAFLTIKFGVWLLFFPLIHLFAKKKVTFGLLVIFLILIFCVGIFTSVFTINLSSILREVF